jgi:Zn-dependent protease
MMSTTPAARTPQGFAFKLNIFDIPVTVEITFILMALVLGSNRRGDATLLIEWILVVLFSVLLHEFGHALVGRAFGLVPRIRLYAFGGLTSWSAGRDISPGKSIVMSLAGPGAGLLLGGLVLLLAPWLQSRDSLLASVAAQDLVFVNIGWGILNLLPIRPLDGGNIAFSLEELITGNRKGRITRVVSLVLAAGVALWALSAGQYWILLLITLMAFSNGHQIFLEIKAKLDKPLRSHLDKAWHLEAARDGAAAIKIAERELRSARSDDARRETSWILVTGHYQQANIEKAREELNRLQARFGAGAFGPFGDELDTHRAVLFFEAAFNLSGSPVLGYVYGESLIRTMKYEQAFELCSRPELQDHSARLYLLLESAAFADGQYAISARAGEQAFAREPHPEVAYNVACALARQSNTEQAIKWVKIALDNGFKDWEMLNTDPDLEALRGHAQFELLRMERA